MDHKLETQTLLWVFSLLVQISTNSWSDMVQAGQCYRVDSGSIT